MSADGSGLSPERLASDLLAASEKFDVVQSDCNTLLVDLDTRAAVAQWERVLPRVRECFGIEKIARWRSKSGNEHAAITLSHPQPIAVRLALQAALGSDGVREVLGLKRMENGCEEPSVLFRPRDARVKTVSG